MIEKKLEKNFDQGGGSDTKFLAGSAEQHVCSHLPKCCSVPTGSWDSLFAPAAVWILIIDTKTREDQIGTPNTKNRIRGILHEMNADLFLQLVEL